MFIVLFRKPPNQYNQIRPKSQVLSSTEPTSYKTHGIKAVVERTFAGKTTCNSIPRLGGRAKVFSNPDVFSGATFVFFLLNIPRCFCGFLWTWYFYLRIADIHVYIYRYGCAPMFFFGCEFFFRKGGTTKIWKTGLRNFHRCRISASAVTVSLH